MSNSYTDECEDCITVWISKNLRKENEELSSNIHNAIVALRGHNFPGNYEQRIRGALVWLLDPSDQSHDDFRKE